MNKTINHTTSLAHRPTGPRVDPTLAGTSKRGRVLKVVRKRGDVEHDPTELAQRQQRHGLTAVTGRAKGGARGAARKACGESGRRGHSPPACGETDKKHFRRSKHKRTFRKDRVYIAIF